jgi:phage gp29-like protein
MKVIDFVRRGIAQRIVSWSVSNFEYGDRGTATIETENMRNVYSLYTEEFSQLTSANLKFYLEGARRGLNWFKAALFEEIKRRDLHIGGVCQTRKLSVVGKHNLARPEDYINCDDEAMKEFVVECLENINLEAFAAEVTDSAISGVSNFELNYDIVNGKWMLCEVKKIPNELLVYDDRINKYKFLAKESLDIFKLRNVSAVVGIEDRIRIDDLALVELPEEKLLEVHSLDGNAQNGLLNGCIDGLIWAYLFKSYTIKDLHVFIELFAIPAIIGKYDPLMSKSDKKKLADAVKNFGNHFRMTVSKDADVQFITDTNKSSSSDIFHTTLNYWDNKISIRVLGQTLTTELGKAGSLAASRTHDAVREDLLHADISVIQRAVNGLIKRVCDLNFDMTGKEYPVFELPESVSIEDKAKLADVYVKVKTLGYNVSKEQVEQELETGELEEDAAPVTEPNPITPPVPPMIPEDKKGFVKRFIGFVDKISNKDNVTDKETEDFLTEIFNEIIK